MGPARVQPAAWGLLRRCSEGIPKDIRRISAMLPTQSHDHSLTPWLTFHNPICAFLDLAQGGAG
jgi:hypothetical protein